MTNKEGVNNLPNVVWSSDIIQKNGCDLNENAFISEHCDTIIGRPTGALSFSATQNNLFQRSCKILYFTNLVPKADEKFWVSELLKNKIQYSASITVTDESDVSKIYGLMESNL